MIPRALSVAVVVPALVCGALFFSGGAAFAAPQNFTSNLSGSNEVPPGDAGMTGKATATVDPSSGQVCAKITSNVTGAVAMHIHKGVAGANGPVVVPLDPKTINGARTCVTVTPAIAAAIVANPAGHYFNIHTPTAPGGATRGQLARAVPSGVNAGVGGQAGTSLGASAVFVPMAFAGAGLAGVAGWFLVRR
jgi:CHRD domain